MAYRFFKCNREMARKARIFSGYSQKAAMPRSPPLAALEIA
ncbi:hypothetical protein SAMCFNEI73_Ch3562 [Sinorhizobium americanum]|uniref:Uncharacterized protein n=1 Tax=Sinorhizobium americanum TaxID=194963 RepID=A0A1L3LRX8_9HYPH|nr:hypothetical protein SAMCCGM7_Ch3460 [Sinorhizobium americanum CCGM7]APG92813.1 hypothetical protein SAMCFNEI73_Ch3562 [Sinorhizobium americanum]